MGEPGVASEAVAPISLRERKKAHTRRRLIETSQRLFLTQGYAETTLEQIAAAVEVNFKTLLRYFPSKQHLALALEYQVLQRFRQGLADPSRAESAPEFYCNFLRGMAGQWVAFESRAERLEYVYFLSREPAIAAQHRMLLLSYEQAIAHAISTDARRRGFDLYAQALASMVVNTMDVVVRRWSERPHEVDLVRSIDAIREFCIVGFPGREQASSLKLAVHRTRRIG